MNLINVNEHTCNKDGRCAAVCPLGLIDFTPGEYTRYKYLMQNNYALDVDTA